jgi:hypothetical protein
MLDDLSGIYGAISLGIGANASWDLQLAERGLMIKQFDHTIERSPVTHDNIRFDKIRISPQAGEACKTLEQIAEDCLHEGTGWILKADIEADEWPVFDAADPKALTIYSQIVCEFHNFRLVGQDSFYSQAIRVLQKLAAEFVPIHVHGNNFAGFSLVGNCPFPDVLEVTFANRSRYTFAEAERFFPTPLDRANNGPVADLILGNFRFGSSPLS